MSSAALHIGPAATGSVHDGAATVCVQEAQYAEKLAKLTARVAELEASRAAVVAEKKNAAVQTDMMTTTVTQPEASHAELPVVPFGEFDSAWCAAACGDKLTVHIDAATRMRAHMARPSYYVTLRGTAPLSRHLPCTGASPQQEFPSYRVVIEAYPTPVDGNGEWCNVGFVPSHTFTDGTPVTPAVGRNIHHYGGWWIQVHLNEYRGLGAVNLHGWKPLLPRRLAGAAVAPEDTSEYATTNRAPWVLAGGAVEFALDYAAGTCRVAFYTPGVVDGGFVEAPYVTMELRFVATAVEDVPGWGAVPARSVPTTAADSRVQLYPAVAAAYAGALWRFV
jgi:hypothetical protein